MATAALPRIEEPETSDRLVLHGIPWAAYVMLRDADENRGKSMSFDDGRLEIMSPHYRHERFSGLLGKVVMAVAGVFAIPCLEAGRTTFQLKGRGPKKGKAKEPDTCFYVGANERRVRGKDEITLPGDPPPDLSVEVDHASDSRSKLPIYAALGVPEVWRFDGEDLWFGRLGTDRQYRAVARSGVFPMLTPEIVLGWLSRSEDMAESQWLFELPAWIRAELQEGPPGREPKPPGRARKPRRPPAP